MTQKSEAKLPDPFEVAQKMFSAWPQFGVAARENLQTFWSNQEKLLDNMQEFSRAWFERRRQATKTAMEAAKCMCEAENPVDAAQHCQTWMAGSAERIVADITALQQHAMKAAELLTAQASAELESRKADIAQVSSGRSSKTQAAA
jgi:hypothetical protein